jgi:hypothetical protein
MMGWKTAPDHWLDFFKHHFILLGFFGQEAIRMLRETWEGVVNVEKDPATGADQVRPSGADRLAQEIFSMLNDQTPQTNNAPVTINQPSGGQGLVLNGSAGAGDPPAFHIPTGSVSMPTTGAISIGTNSSSTSAGTLITLGGSSIVIPPLGILNLPPTAYDPLTSQLPELYFPNSSVPIGGQAFMGKVVANVGGGQYAMELAGLTGSVTATLASYPTGYNLPLNTYCVVVSTKVGDLIDYIIQPFPLTQSVGGMTANAGAGGALKSLTNALQAAGIIVDGTTAGTNQTVSGATQSLTAGGALSNLLLALNNLGIIVKGTTDSPAAFGPTPLQYLAPGGALHDLCLALNGLGITAANVTDSRQPLSGSRSNTAGQIPALNNVITALINLGICTDAGLTP